MIGEIRDLQTAEMAIQAALTGHLVISTLHTNDSPTAITRMLDLGVPSYMIKATVLGVMERKHHWAWPSFCFHSSLSYQKESTAGCGRWDVIAG